jgi:hypothetical protein
MNKKKFNDLLDNPELVNFGLLVDFSIINELWKNKPELGFELDDKVLVCSNFGKFISTINGIQRVDDKTVEFTVKGFSFLLYDWEIKHYE